MMAHYVSPHNQKGRNFYRRGEEPVGSLSPYKEACFTASLRNSPFLRLAFMAVILTICCMFLSIKAPARQKLPSTEAIVERLNSLEKENQHLEKDVADLKKENDELEASLKEYEPFRFWAWILGGLGVTSVLGLLFLYFKMIPDKVNNQVDAVITKMLTDRREDFLCLLKEYDFEKTVKERHRVVLLSHRNGSDNYHYRMLTKNGFNVHPQTKLEHLQDAKFASEDILVINDDGYHWTPEQIQAFINAHPNYCFYFGKGKILPDPNRMDRFAAANFQTQFIGNLMNLLKYSHHQN